VKRVFDKANFETAEIAGGLDIPVRAIDSQTFFEYHLQQTDHGQELFPRTPDLNLQDAFTRPSVPVLSDLTGGRDAVLFDQQLSEAGKTMPFRAFIM
jgi:hypothetical protein